MGRGGCVREENTPLTRPPEAAAARRWSALAGSGTGITFMTRKGTTAVAVLPTDKRRKADKRVALVEAAIRGLAVRTATAAEMTRRAANAAGFPVAAVAAGIAAPVVRATWKADHEAASHCRRASSIVDVGR